jgi:hypothetical protein
MLLCPGRQDRNKICPRMMRAQENLLLLFIITK